MKASTERLISIIGLYKSQTKQNNKTRPENLEIITRTQRSKQGEGLSKQKLPKLKDRLKLTKQGG